MRKAFIAVSLFAVIAVVLAGPVWADFKPRISQSGATVNINGRAAVKFKVGNGSLTPARRAEITAGRLAASYIDPKSIYAQGDNKQGRVYAGETMICIATSADAKASGTDALSLAVVWASNIKSLLSMPPIVLSDKDLIVPLGETRNVAVGGAATGRIFAKSQDDNTALATVASDGRYVQVLGQQLGETTVEISVDGEKVTLPVHVKKYAGRLIGKTVAEVTGNPCPVSTIRYAVRQAVSRNVVCEPGAIVEFVSINCGDGALAGAAERDVNAEIRISGPGYIPFCAKADVNVRNVPMKREEVSRIFYSNDPERLLKYQVLFAGKLAEGEPTRVLFHHQNAMGKSAHFLTDIINSSQIPVKIRIARAVSGPLTDTVLVGYKASLEFLKDDMGDVSVIETIPPESRLVMVSDMLGHLDTTSGILQITQISGPQAYIRIVANPPGLDNVSAGDIAPAPNPLVLAMSEHVYPLPVKNLKADYIVGKRWAFISIGKNALTDATEQKKLYGNYGVTYRIDVKVENPTDKSKKVSVLFDPSAGLASGVFYIDGEFVSTKYVKPPSEFTLKSYQLKPGEVRYVRIVTLPVAGSNYPATLVVRS
ncbi:MAG: hypothetical protein ABFD49_08270 [Armatimonadota bacterium]|nr:hypothetical protein [bacterium]